MERDDEPNVAEQLHSKWDREVTAARKRLKKFTTRGNTVVKRFLDERHNAATTESIEATGSQSNGARLNLFHTNVSTLQSMLYGQTPKIDVAREHQDPDDDVARVASNILQRIIEADISTSGEDMASTCRAALQDRLLPGLGVARVRYDFTEMEVELPQLGNIEGEDPLTVTITQDESADIEYVNWQDFIWGWGRTWPEVPWVGYRIWLTKDEAAGRFGSKIASNLEYQNQLPTGEGKSEAVDEKEARNSIQKAPIWEIWDKTDRKVLWYSQSVDKILDVKDDPMGLAGFIPSPKPLLANVTTTELTPVADYILAQDLYTQCDELYARIQIITRAVKVVGVYDQKSEAVRRMLTEGVENDLIPVENWAMFGEQGGLRGVVDWFPVEQVVGTLATLRQILGETIELLYQVTGLSDILRGANTDQYTSDGTQQLKAKFGSVRVQSLQDEFARFCSDLAALKAEVVSKKFEPRTIARQANLDYMSPADMQYLDQAMALVKSEDVRWRIQIRPESLAMIDYAQLKNERIQYITAVSTYVQSAQAMAKAVPGSMPILLEFLKFGMAGFKGADYMEGILDQAIEGAKQQARQAQQGQQGPSEAELKLQSEQIKLQGIQAKIQGDLQKIQQKAQADMQNIRAKMQAALMEIQADAERDQQLEHTQSRYSLVEVMQEFDNHMQTIQAEMESALTIEAAQAENDMMVNDQELSHQLRLISAQGRNDA